MKKINDTFQVSAIKIINFMLSLTLITFLISCESPNNKIKENSIFQISDSQYEQMRIDCSKKENQSKTVFLGFKLGSTADEGQRHLYTLLKEGKIKKMKGDSKDYFDFIIETEINAYDFIIEGTPYRSDVSYGLDLEKKFVKHVTVSIDYMYISAGPIYFGDIYNVVELLKIKYGEPTRAIKKDTWFNSYYWLKDGYEIELKATEEFIAGTMYKNKIVFHINFTDLNLEYSNNELKIQRKLQKSDEGKEKMINDL